jgi:hypothetical protein
MAGSVNVAVFRVVTLIAMMMEATSTSEPSVNLYHTTRCYSLEDSRNH